MILANERANLLQSTENVQKYAAIVMWSVIFFLTLKLIGSVVHLVLFAKYDNSMSIDYIRSTDELLIALISLANMPWVALGAIFIVLYSGWLHRSYTNLIKQEVQGLQHTPAWTIGWNFMPVMQLFKPYMIMKEIWRATFYADGASKEWQRQEVPRIFPFWWLFFVIGILTLFNWLLFGQTFFSLKMGAWLSIISAISLIISGLMLVKIMKQITRTQIARFKEEE